MRIHPALEKLYKDNRGQTVKEDEYEKFFNFVVIDRYVSVNQQQLRSGLGGVETLVYLQNTKPIDNYTKAVNDLTDRSLPIIDNPTPKTEKYIDTLQAAPRRVAANRRLDVGAVRPWRSIDALARRSGRRGDQAAGPGRVLGDGRDTLNSARTFEKLRDEVKYGDPLYVTKRSARAASWRS